MHREKRRNKIIIAVLVCIICLMGAGYAAFRTQISVTGVGNISGEWSIKITNVEVTEEYGGGTNKTFSFKNTTAELEADLYNKGDYVIYNITVANEGDFDAKLESLNLDKSTNEAVLITSEGLVKGETLLKGESTQFTVKIEYNPSFAGDATGTSGMADLTLDFVQNSGGTIIPTEDYLVTYDYTTNGGTSTNAENAYLAAGEAVNLNYTATKENAEFLGWNTNPQAGGGLQSLTMPASNITLYAIFKDIDATAPVINNINTISTTNSIIIVTTATEEDGEIDTYEYSIDDGKSWATVSGSISYTFTGLTSNTEYTIKVRVKNTGGIYDESTVSTKTKQLNKPTFSEVRTNNGTTVAITYPQGEGFAYEYQKDGGSWIKANQIQEVEFAENGILVAKVSDGTNIEIVTYTVEVGPTVGGVIIPTVVENSGLYKDTYEEGRYAYKGANPNNYVTFNGEQWRIISIENDGTIKIIKTSSIGDDYWDTRASNNWGRPATLNSYLNGTYYNNNLNSTAKTQIVTHVFNTGAITDNNDNLTEQIKEEMQRTWSGKIAFATLSEYLRANNNVEQCGTLYLNNGNYNICKETNWMFNKGVWWTLSANNDNTVTVFAINSSGSISDARVDGYIVDHTLYESRPVVTLSSNVKIVSGDGSSSAPYQLSL